jgi:hypothetical protein
MMDQEMRARLLDDDRLHGRLLTYAKNRVTYSRDWMQPRFERWRESEQTLRLFREPDASDAEVAGEPLTQGVQKIVVPVSYAQLWSMLAFLMNALMDRKPMIPVEGVGPRDVKPAMLHELLLEYQWDNQQQKGVLGLMQWFHDALRYGVGVVHNAWVLRIFADFVRSMVPVVLNGMQVGFEDILEEQDVVAYEGNEFRNVQPFDWLPDPRVNSFARFQEGEFCGHAFMESTLHLAQLEEEGLYVGIEQIPDYSTGADKGGSGRFWSDSDLGPTIGLDGAGGGATIDAEGQPFKRCHSLYGWMAPGEYGLPDYGQNPRRPRLWVLTMANEARIIRAERANLPGRKFPYGAIESNYDVHAPANPGMVETVQGLQYIYSWLFNSRMAAVRRTLNPETIIDPSLIEREDWARSNISGIWRLTKNAMQGGISLDQVAKPMPIQDVTQGHLSDANVVASLIEQTTGASRHIQGLANPGRRAATEVQGQLGMAAGRMRLILLVAGAQGITDLCEQQVSNNRAFLEQRLTIRVRDTAYARVLKQDYLDVTPDLLQGRFRIPLLESGIPTDKLMHANVLRELLTLGMQNPAVGMQLSQQINWSEIFVELMRILNKRNLQDFFVLAPPQPQMGMPGMVPMGDEQVQQGAAAGDLIPAGAGPPGGGMVGADGFPYMGAAGGAPGMSGAAPLLQ